MTNPEIQNRTSHKDVEMSEPETNTRPPMTMDEIDAWIQKDITPWLEANAARGIYEQGPDLEEIEMFGF